MPQLVAQFPGIFKSTLRWDMREETVNRKLEFVIAKTVSAFLNTEGGVLIMGVDDAKNILGLAKNYKILKKPDRDGLNCT